MAAAEWPQLSGRRLSGRLAAAAGSAAAVLATRDLAASNLGRRYRCGRCGAPGRRLAPWPRWQSWARVGRLNLARRSQYIRPKLRRKCIGLSGEPGGGGCGSHGAGRRDANAVDQGMW